MSNNYRADITSAYITSASISYNGKAPSVIDLAGTAALGYWTNDGAQVGNCVLKWRLSVITYGGETFAELRRLDTFEKAELEVSEPRFTAKIGDDVTKGFQQLELQQLADRLAADAELATRIDLEYRRAS